MITSFAEPDTKTFTIYAPNITSSPADVHEYLINNGWIPHYINNRPYYYQSDRAGYFTWEQALLYNAFKMMNFGGTNDATK